MSSSAKQRSADFTWYRPVSTGFETPNPKTGPNVKVNSTVQGSIASTGRENHRSKVKFQLDRYGFKTHKLNLWLTLTKPVETVGEGRTSLKTLFSSAGIVLTARSGGTPSLYSLRRRIYPEQRTGTPTCNHANLRQDPCVPSRNASRAPAEPSSGPTRLGRLAFFRVWDLHLGRDRVLVPGSRGRPERPPRRLHSPRPPKYPIAAAPRAPGAPFPPAPSPAR